MEIPTPTYLFESGLQNSPPLPTPSSRLDEIIQAKLKMAADDVSKPKESPSDRVQAKPKTVIGDMGDYITQTACIWAHLTESLIKGPHIDQVAFETLKQAKNENRCADLTAVTALELDLDKLRKIRDLTAQYSQDVQNVWQQKNRLEDGASKKPYPGTSSLDLKPQSMQTSAMISEDNKGAVRRVLPGTAQSDHVSPPDDGSGSDESDEEDDERFSQAKMDALKTRGKGDHYCPKGYQCTKGGVDKDGNLVQFDRNSAFAQHCNKHRKPYRCNLDGCPNPVKKRRFARRDGLERHQKHVPHIITHPVATL